MKPNPNKDALEAIEKVLDELSRNSCHMNPRVFQNDLNNFNLSYCGDENPLSEPEDFPGSEDFPAIEQVQEN